MIVNEIAHYMALVPLAVLGGLHARGRERDAAWWWMACAFAISWVADSVASQLVPVHRWAVTLVYPIVQSAMIGVVLLSRRAAFVLLGGLVAIGCLAVFWRGVKGPDVILHSVASLSVAGIVWIRRDIPLRLRMALVVYFGLGLVAWLLFAQQHSIPTWYGYQGARLAGLLVFSWAVLKPGPSLRVLHTL